jgi:hypothetical protein
MLMHQLIRKAFDISSADMKNGKTSLPLMTKYLWPSEVGILGIIHCVCECSCTRWWPLHLGIMIMAHRDYSLATRYWGRRCSSRQLPPMPWSQNLVMRFPSQEEGSYDHYTCFVGDKRGWFNVVQRWKAREFMNRLMTRSFVPSRTKQWWRRIQDFGNT